jgi:hypothetical protein
LIEVNGISFRSYASPFQRSGGILLCICLSVRKPNGFRSITKERLGLGTWYGDYSLPEDDPCSFWGLYVKGQGQIDLEYQNSFQLITQQLMRL